MTDFDIIIVGAGTAGMPCAISAVAAGVRVFVVEQSDQSGGALHVSLGQLSGAGTQLQQAAGIDDSAAAHLDDINRINGGSGRSDLLERTVSRQGQTIDWLMELGFDMDPACPAILHLHEAYTTARTYWGLDGGLSVLTAIRPIFDDAMAQPNADLRYGTRTVALISNGGKVTGLRLKTAKQTNNVTARAVVLATGGYGGNAAMFERLTGRPLITAAPDTATGAGIEMAHDLGACIVGADKYLPTYAGIPHNPDGNRIIWRQMPALTPQQRLPWELHFPPMGAALCARIRPASMNVKMRCWVSPS